MMTKVFDLLRSLGWYIISFIYNLIDTLLEIIKKLNAFDIINSLSNNQAFKNFYTGVMARAVTLFALFIIWKFVNKLLDPDEENTFKNIIFPSDSLVKNNTLYCPFARSIPANKKPLTFCLRTTESQRFYSTFYLVSIQAAILLSSVQSLPAEA